MNRSNSTSVEIPSEFRAMATDYTDSDHEATDRLKRRTGQLAAITSVVTAVSQSLDTDQTLQTALKAILSVIPLDSSAISLVDESTAELVFRAQLGLRYDFVTKPLRVKIDQGMAGIAVRTGEIVVQRGKIEDDPRLAGQEFALENTKAMALAPMRARGKVIGVLSVMSHDPYDFDAEQLTVLSLIADQVGIAVDNARLYSGMSGERRRLEAILATSADGIISFGKNNAITLFNATAETLFDVKAKDIVGVSLEEASLPPLIRAKLLSALKRFPPTLVRFDTQLGDGKYLSVIVSPVDTKQSEDNDADGWVAIFQDVTHIKAAERSRMQFIQMAAHDLRNPLSATLSALTMLNKGMKSATATDKEVLNIALTGVNRMQELIDDLLNLEHIEAGLDMRHEPVNIPDLVERVSIDMSPILTKKSQTLKLDVDLQMPMFYGDERWLYRALANLISNAHKYTQDNSTITMHAHPAGSQLVIEVEDNGPGIPREAQDRLFERFYRVRSTEKIPGTGLGLSLVKSVAERHEGRAFVSSVVGRGSTFRMIMPFLPPK